MQTRDHQQKRFQAQLRPVVSNHFVKATVPSEMTMKEFREKNELAANRCNVFLELKSIKSKKNIIDVILMDTEVEVLYVIIYIF